MKELLKINEEYEENMKKYEVNIYGFLLREQELWETRCLCKEICSGRRARNSFKSKNLYRGAKSRTYTGIGSESLLRDEKLEIILSPKAYLEGESSELF